MILQIIICVVNLLCILASLYVFYKLMKDKQKLENKRKGWIKPEGEK